MIELLLKPTNGLQYYPNSGPGTKYLRQGDTDLGVFGEVPESDIGLFPALLDRVNVPSADRLYNPLGANNTWIKMFYKGKVIYLPMFPTARVSYQLLENANVTYDFFKAGTPDAPTTLPSGKAMWRLGQIFESPSGAVFYPRLSDAKPNAASAAEGEAIGDTSEFYNTVLSVFFTQYNNSKNVKLSGDYITRFVGNQSPLVHVSESSSATMSARTPVNTGHASFGKVTVWTTSGSTELWLPVLQMLDPSDLAKVPVAPSYIESWTDEVNSKPVVWADSDSLIPPYNFQAPLSQSIIGPTLDVDSVFGVVLKPPHREKFETDTQSILSAIEPKLITAGTTEFLRPTNASLPTTSGRDRWVRKSRHFSGTMQFQGAFFGITATNIVVYSGMGRGGNTGVQYSSSIYQYLMSTSGFSAVQSPGTWTWNSGVQIGNMLYLCDGHFDSAAQAGQLRRINMASPASGFTGLAQGNGIAGRKTSVMCSIGTTKIFRFGGWNYSAATIQNSGGIYDITANTWAYIANAPEGRLFASAFHYDGKVYVVGGQTATGAMATKIMVYTIATNTWVMSDAPVPNVQGFSEGQFYNGRYILPVIFRDSLFSFGFLVIDPATLAYEKVFTSEPIRYMACGNIVGDEMIVAGGGGWLGPSDWDNAPPACGAVAFKLSDIVP